MFELKLSGIQKNSNYYGFVLEKKVIEFGCKISFKLTKLHPQ